MDLPVLSRDALIKPELTAQWEESRTPGTWAVSLSPLPTQQGELDPPPGKERIQHVPAPVPLLHGPFLGVLVLSRVMLSAPCIFSYNREWPSGKAPRIGTRLLFSCCSQDWK